MTAQNHFRVEPDQIRGHATTLGGVADQLSSVAAGLPDGPADQALGTFAQFLADGLQGAMARTKEAIAHASSSVDEMSTGLKRTAEGYQCVDEDNATRFGREDA